MREKVARYLEKIEREDRKINAFIEVNKNALNEAEKIKKNRKLSGIVIAVKSNINVTGLRSTCASKTLENYVSGYDADVVRKIKEEGGIVIGMTNMDEFACGSSGETSYFGPTQNPSSPGRIPGGSSSGSAAAVAAGFCDAALGSDTGGSIRNPASHCGVLGIKPTYGLVSRHGLIDLAMSLDQIGCFAREVKTLAALLEVIAGKSVYDATTEQAAKQSKYSEKLGSIRGMKIGYAKEFEEVTDPKINKVIEKSIEKLKELGAEVKEVRIPDLEKALPTYYLINFVEFFSGTRKFDGRRYGHRIEEVCGKEVLRRIEIGRYISKKEYAGKYYKKALQFRALIKNEVMEALSDVDVLAGPTVPRIPHKIGEEIDALAMYGYDILTTPANLAGIPAGVINAGRVEGTPVGLQLHAKHWEEQKILNVMHALEAAGKEGGRI